MGNCFSLWNEAISINYSNGLSPIEESIRPRLTRLSLVTTANHEWLTLHSLQFAPKFPTIPYFHLNLSLINFSKWNKFFSFK